MGEGSGGEAVGSSSQIVGVRGPYNNRCAEGGQAGEEAAENCPQVRIDYFDRARRCQAPRRSDRRHKCRVIEKLYTSIHSHC